MNPGKFYCAECGGEIIVSYKNSVTFSIEEGGKLKVEYENSDHEEVFFHCSNDMDHTINPDVNSRLFIIFERWIEEVEELLYEKVTKEVYKL